MDHGDRSSDFEAGSVAAKMPGARMDEKTGKPVVDVVEDGSGGLPGSDLPQVTAAMFHRPGGRCGCGLRSPHQ